MKNLKKNRTILITGANAGIGRETARQLAGLPDTERIILACRNPEKAKVAREELEKETGKDLFEVVIMDVSKPSSVKKSLDDFEGSVDALILNAGGTGGRHPAELTAEGVTQITATNLLGHVVLVEELIKNNRLENVVLFASSEAARGIRKMGMKRPDLKNSSEEEFASVFDGTAFGKEFDPMQVYGVVKYGGTLWMSAMARRYPQIRFVSISPGGTRGTQGFDDLPTLQRIMFKYLGMPILMPLIGLSHSLAKGAGRFVKAIGDSSFESGRFYASKEGVLTGTLVDQEGIFPDLGNKDYQENADAAIRRFIRE